MHVERLLHKLLSPVMHLKRLTTLYLAVESALEYKELSVVKLGRGMSRGLPIQAASGIKRADRLIGNRRLHEERKEIYKSLAHELVRNNPRPCIIVDWSHVPNTTSYFLRAAVVSEGRTLTVWEEVHEEKDQGKAKVHQGFLSQLKRILPPGVKPILVTDAGFGNPWFKAILKKRWDYVGRIRGRKCYQLTSEKGWSSYQTLTQQTRCGVIYLGAGKLCKKNTLDTHFYYAKLQSKGRKSLNRQGKQRQGKSEKEYRKANQEPWLLVTSLSRVCLEKEHIVKLYQKRMQIEESFRDLKSAHYGLSLEQAHSQGKVRISILLLIGSLASFVAHVIGLAAEACKLHYEFQTNSIKNRRVLSLFYLGCEVIRKKMKIPLSEMNIAIHTVGVYSC